MSTIFFLLSPLYFVAFVAGIILPIKNHKKWYGGSLAIALVSFLPLVLFGSAVSGPGAGLALAPLMLLALLTSFVSSGFSAGVFCRSLITQGQNVKSALLGLTLIPLPLLLGYAAQLGEKRLDDNDLKARNAIWQKQANVRLGNKYFTLPISPRQHWIYQVEDGSSHGAALQQKRYREFINARITNGLRLVTLKSLTIKSIDPTCGVRNSDWKTQEYCKKTGLHAITLWCELNPNLMNTFWCETGEDAQKYEVTFYIEDTGKFGTEDGDCIKGYCYAHTDITAIISANIKFEEGEKTSNALEGQIYAKRIWDEIIKNRESD